MDTNPYDDWWSDEHSTGELEIESDVDECVTDTPFDDIDEY